MWTSARCSLPGLLCLLALAACAGLPSSDPDPDALDRELDRLETRGMVGQVVVADREGILYQRGLGKVRTDNDEPVTPDHVFPLASLTKPFTAAAILALAADGRLALDDRLGEHLSGLESPWADIPLESLLTHTSGFPAEIVNRAWDGDPQFEPVDREEFVGRIRHFPPDHPPGEGYNYSNVGYGLLGALIEEVTGSDWEAWLRERLLEPAGLEAIGLMHPQWTEKQIVEGRQRGQGWGTYLDQPRLEDGLGFHLRASGDLHAPATAVVDWWKAVASEDFLDPEWTGRWLTPRVDEQDGTRYGYGWHFRDSRHGPVIGHTGGNRIYAVDFSWFRDPDILVYIATAESRFEADLLADRIHRSLLGR